MASSHSDVPPVIASILEDEGVTFEQTTIDLAPEDFDGDDSDSPAYFVGCGVTRNGDELLLVRHGDDPHKSGWIVPGGSVEADETLREAARREVREESGVECSVTNPLAVTEQTFRLESDYSQTTTGYFVLFEASPETDTVTDDPGLEDEGITAVDWFDSVPDETPQPELIEHFLL